MDSKYKHQVLEPKIYNLWQKNGFFNPDNNPQKQNGKPFCIIMPPPNANDPLHLGHALGLALEDAIIRYHRMLGDDTLWLPGTDHAGIETQFVFEKKLKKNHQSRFDFDRQTLFDMIWKYVKKNSQISLEQMKKIGASADWSRLKFTLDQDIVDFVYDTFIKLHQDGLIYRDFKLINYCFKCGTSYSELEVKHINQITNLYYLKYGPLVLATTRPETKFADTALAVHPTDKRYQKYIGKEIEVGGLLGKFRIKVIADKLVDPDFGTGVVKITPYHDFNDFEIWQRHKNDMPTPKQVIDFQGKLTQIAGKYAGLKVLIARNKVVNDLKTAGLLIKTQSNYQNTIGVCYRCGNILEPLPLPQFFVKVEPLVKQVLKLIKQKKVKIIGSGHDKILNHWLTNLKDWNISRQIVWGVRLPIWYSIDQNPDIKITYIDKKTGQKKNQKISDFLNQKNLESLHEKIAIEKITASKDAKYVVSKTSPGKNYIQETDTFDTWFSSGQWPIACLKTTQIGDFARFYPTNVMETAYDILPFWVIRMLLLGVYLTKKSPFNQVYFHGLIRDQKGQKMSKSKGNVIDPLEIIEKYGADALRVALVIRSNAGLDKAVAEADFRAARNFANKFWNAARYIIQNDSPSLSNQNQSEDENFNKKLSQIIKKTTNQLDNLKLGLALDNLYNNFWHWFCDVGIEQNKKGLVSFKTLKTGLKTFCLLLHPFMPFVTESVWLELHRLTKSQNRQNLLAITKWPKPTNL